MKECAPSRSRVSDSRAYFSGRIHRKSRETYCQTFSYNSRNADLPSEYENHIKALTGDAVLPFLRGEPFKIMSFSFAYLTEYNLSSRKFCQNLVVIVLDQNDLLSGTAERVDVPSVAFLQVIR